ncbi:DUF3987 domain-containing protein [Ralstonia pseudosolanacearum]|uniref:DUF3987 domain-containing protein n=1 Tax=Ralstonia pseudosolanacearum TaxID=1310165 RepID=UPI00386E8F14
MMHAPAYQMGGGLMPSQNFIPSQPVGHYLQSGYVPPTIWQAINSLTPGLHRAAIEQRAVYGSTYEAILANLLGKVSFAAASNFRIRGHNGKPMPLALQIYLSARPLSGKTDAHDRYIAPINEAMKGWKKSWLFNNVTPAASRRKMRAGSVLVMVSMDEGRGYLARQFSRVFDDLNDHYAGKQSGFDRADDDDEALADAKNSVVFVVSMNAQSDAVRKWLDEYGQEALSTGYLFRLLMLQTEETAVEGAGRLQPEVALLDYDQVIVEMVASGRIKLTKMEANQLPVIDVTLEAEQLLPPALERHMQMASPFMSAADARTFAVRLSANTRRIAGCMHAYERYEGAVSADTMTRAITIAECFAAHWLAMVFPPKPLPAAMQRGQRLLDYLYDCARRAGGHFPSCRKSDLEVLAPNFGWTKAEMTEAITAICERGVAQVVPRIENGRRVVKFELINNPVGLQQFHCGPPQLL